MSSQFTFEAIGTGWTIDLWQDISSEKSPGLLEKIKARIDIFDKNYSRFRVDSLVTEMSQKAGEYILPEDARPMMDIYHDLFFLTDGLLTPLIGQVMVDAGYDPEYSLKQKKELESPKEWNGVLEYAHPRLTVKSPILLDFGAAGKGYLIDLVGQILSENGVTDFCIDAGGDILERRVDGTAMRIGLENPENFSEVIGVCELSNASLCGSAGSRRKWSGIEQNFHHIIDPKKLASPREILATWVVAETTLLADALATALFFVPPEKLLSRYDFQYVIMYDNHSAVMSPKFPGEIFLK